MKASRHNVDKFMIGNQILHANGNFQKSYTEQQNYTISHFDMQNFLGNAGSNMIGKHQKCRNTDCWAYQIWDSVPRRIKHPLIDWSHGNPQCRSGERSNS
jgi:hypothetical protein